MKLLSLMAVFILASCQTAKKQQDEDEVIVNSSIVKREDLETLSKTPENCYRSREPGTTLFKIKCKKEEAIVRFKPMDQEQRKIGFQN